MFSHGAVEISDTKNRNDFKVKGQRLKSFLESVPVNETCNIPLPEYVLSCIFIFYDRIFLFTSGIYFVL